MKMSILILPLHQGFIKQEYNLYLYLSLSSSNFDYRSLSQGSSSCLSPITLKYCHLKIQVKKMKLKNLSENYRQEEEASTLEILIFQQYLLRSISNLFLNQAVNTSKLINRKNSTVKTISYLIFLQSETVRLIFVYVAVSSSLSTNKKESCA